MKIIKSSDSCCRIRFILICQNWTSNLPKDGKLLCESNAIQITTYIGDHGQSLLA